MRTPDTRSADRAPIGYRHPRWPLLTGIGIGAGFLLALVWSAHFVDHVIGGTIADTLLGEPARDAVLASSAAGLLFAAVSGLAGSFTACNIAVLGAAPQLAATLNSGVRARLRAMVSPLAWLAAGMVVVAASYGFIAVLAGTGMPQATAGSLSRDGGLPPLITQSMLVFGVIGLAFCYLGLAALRMVPDPFETRPHWRLFTIGALVGAFLVGRPYPLFRQLVAHAVEQNNPLYGAVAFVLQSLGNIAIMVALVVLLVFGTRGRFPRWLAAEPTRAAGLTGAALLTFGSFTIVYWTVRVPSLFGIGWFPVMPWNI